MAAVSRTGRGHGEVRFGWMLLGCCVGLSPAVADVFPEAAPLSAEQVKARWHGRLDRRHFSARVHLALEQPGLREDRELIVWRDDASGDGERVMIRFESPPDLRRVGLLYLERTDRPNDYFLYQPALRRVRRLPEALANEDVYGIDLEFMGFGVAQSEPTEVESVRADVLGGRAAWRLAERALRANPRFERRVTWLDAEHFIPLRTEHHRGGRLRLVATTLETRAVQGVATPLRMRFERPGTGRRVELRVDGVDYESPIPEEYFSTLALLRAQLATGGPKPD